MRRGKDYPLGSPGRYRGICSARLRLLDVHGRRVLGNPTTIAHGDVEMAADQGRGRLFLVVIDNPNKPAALGCSAA
jgi:hypothetical protein